MELEFRVTPQKTFFGLDKAGGNCFTVPKNYNAELIRFFRLGEGKLQQKVSLIIDDGSGLEPIARQYPAIIRLVRMNRSRPNKLEAEDLPKREVIQFDWRSFEITRAALRFSFSKSYQEVSAGRKNESQCITFLHVGNGIFELSEG